MFMNRKTALLGILILSCIFVGCSKYKHSSRVSIKNIEDTSSLDSEELAAIREEEEVMKSMVSNINVEDYRRNLSDKGLTEEVAQEGTAIYFNGKTDAISSSVATADGQKTTCILIQVNKNFEEVDGAKKEFISFLQGSLETIDKEYDEAIVNSIVEIIEKYDSKYEERTPLSDNIIYRIMDSDESYDIYLYKK